MKLGNQAGALGSAPVGVEEAKPPKLNNVQH